VLVVAAAMPNKHGVRVVTHVDDKCSREDNGFAARLKATRRRTVPKSRATGLKQWRR
jgi:hypothetical protein